MVLLLICTFLACPSCFIRPFHFQAFLALTFRASFRAFFWPLLLSPRQASHPPPTAQLSTHSRHSAFSSRCVTSNSFLRSPPLLPNRGVTLPSPCFSYCASVELCPHARYVPISSYILAAGLRGRGAGRRGGCRRAPGWAWRSEDEIPAEAGNPTAPRFGSAA